jgi:quercetin dioxygenase-like cupin family protein
MAPRSRRVSCSSQRLGGLTRRLWRWEVVMSKILTSLSVLCVVVAAVAIASAATAPTIVPAGGAKWTPVAGMAGLQMATLYGTPSKAGTGTFVIRYKATSDVTFPPHSHPTDEMVTVLAGTLMVNLGDKINWTGAKTLTAGAFAGIPAGIHHFGMLKAGGIIQVSGIAPDDMIMVKPSKSSM